MGFQTSHSLRLIKSQNTNLWRHFPFNIQHKAECYESSAFVKNVIPIHSYSNTYLLHRWLTWAIRTHWAEQLLWTLFQTASSRRSVPLDNSFLQQSDKCLHLKKHWVHINGHFQDSEVSYHRASEVAVVSHQSYCSLVHLCLSVGGQHTSICPLWTFNLTCTASAAPDMFINPGVDGMWRWTRGRHFTCCLHTARALLKTSPPVDSVTGRF